MSGFEIAALAVSAIGTATSVVMQSQAASNQAQAQADAADYQRRVAERDQVIADQNRQSALEQGRIASEDEARDARRRLSAIRTAYGASGVDLAGSPLDVLADSAAETQLDVARTEYGGRVRARESALQMLGLQDTANMAEQSASYARSSARSAQIGGLVGGASALASGATKVYTSGVKSGYWG